MRTARGMTLVEVVVGVAVVAMLGAMLAAAVGESRRMGSLNRNLGNLQLFAAGTIEYAAAHQDRFWGFSWQQGHEGPFGVAPTRMQAAADQAVEILRRRGGVTMDRVEDWHAGANYAHLPLLDHLDMPLQSEFIVAPEHRLLMLWRSDPENIVNLPPTQRPDSPAESLHRWGYSSSYELAPAFQEADARWTDENGAPVLTADQHGREHDRWWGVTTGFGSRYLHEVSSPSQKVMMFERYQRHFGPRHIYFMSSEARVPMLFADGAVSVRQTWQSNLGFRPNSPNVGGPGSSGRGGGPSLVAYTPAAWEPPTASGFAIDRLAGQYRWTRGGLKGRDFNGSEIDTTDW